MTFPNAGLSESAAGFSLGVSALEIAWKGQCKPQLVGIRGGILTDSHGSEYWLGTDALTVREGARRRADQEPSPPAWASRRFVSSKSLHDRDWRVGLWVGPNGRYEIARYRSGSTDLPIALLASAKPIVDLTYLPNPDATGGSLSILQRTGKANYRLLSLRWSEEGLRTPSPKAD